MFSVWFLELLVNCLKKKSITYTVLKAKFQENVPHFFFLLQQEQWEVSTQNKTIVGKQAPFTHLLV